MSEKKWFLGYTKKDLYGSREAVYLYDFSWNCDWYWGGGYIGNSRFHTHFDNCFLESIDSRGHSLGNFFDPWTKIPEYVENYVVVSNGASVWEPIEFFLDDVPEHIQTNWWRIKDLFKQFYALRNAAEVFQYGGHCTTKGRNPNELNKEMADKINKHIETVIIPEIRKIFDNGEEK